jgi:hypothetical protein
VSGQQFVTTVSRAGQERHNAVCRAFGHGKFVIKLVIEPLYATTRYTWNTSAYSRFTLMPWVRATFHTYSLLA